MKIEDVKVGGVYWMIVGPNLGSAAEVEVLRISDDGGETPIELMWNYRRTRLDAPVLQYCWVNPEQLYATEIECWVSIHKKAYEMAKLHSGLQQNAIDHVLRIIDQTGAS